jgi:hypothetical protein
MAGNEPAAFATRGAPEKGIYASEQEMIGETMDNVDIQLFSLPQIRTRMGEDLVPTDKHSAWYPQMGIIPGSDEGAAMEKSAGDIRRLAIQQIAPSIDLFTGVATDLMQRAILLHRGQADLEDIPIPLSSLPLATLAVTRAVIVQLLDFGILNIKSYTVEAGLE